MQKTFILVVLLICLLVFAGCSSMGINEDSEDNTVKHTLTVKIMDEETREGIKGEVTVNGRTKTGSAVQFDLKDGTYTVRASADDYIGSSKEVTINGKDISLTIKLIEDKTYDNYELDNGDLLLGNSDYPAFSYGGFRGDTRDETPTVDQIKEDMKILQAMGVKLLRTYNTTEYPHAERLLEAIDELKTEDSSFEMYVMIGAWIQCEGAYTDNANPAVGDEDKNKQEIEKAIEFANKYPDIVKIIAVGNEAMVNWQPHHVNPDIILKWVNYLKKARATGDMPAKILITSSDNYASWGGEGEYQNDVLEDLIKAVDFISLHTYPFHDTHYNPDFWYTPEGDSGLSDMEKIDNAMTRAVDYAKSQYQAVADYIEGLGIDKPIHIGETGWATVDNVNYGEEGSRAADEYKEKKYYNAVRDWTNQNNISCFYFEAFDEPWKDPNNPSGLENHFGLFTVEGKAKYALWDLVDNGTFAGLTRGGSSITKTYSGDETALLAEISPPPNESTTGSNKIETINEDRDAGTTVTEENYVILSDSMNPDENSNMTYPSDILLVNPWEGTCGMELVDGVIEVVSGTGDWWGCGLEIDADVGEDLTNFSEGHLHFDIKGETEATFNIGFQTGVWGSDNRPQTNNYVTFNSGQSYQLSPEWVSYSIPVSDLKADDADLTDVTSLLYLMGDGAYNDTFDGNKIYLKNIYYTQD